MAAPPKPKGSNRSLHVRIPRGDDQIIRDAAKLSSLSVAAFVRQAAVAAARLLLETAA